MIKVSVPATSANLGPGFDSLGIALNLFNIFYFYDKDKDTPPRGLKILSQNSLVHRAANLVAAEAGLKAPQWQVAIDSQIPRSRGLGSSASLTVAGLVAANYYLAAGFAEEKLISLASRLEGHPDNAAPALVGGLVISISTSEGVKYLKTMPGSPVQAIVAVPDFELPTVQSRQVLPRQVSYKDAVQNTGRTALFVSAMILGDYDKLRYAMEDVLHQPYRFELVPGIQEVMAAALEAGALGSCLSGAGPSILAFANKQAETVSRKMVEAWEKAGIKAKTYILDINNQGAQLTIL